MRKVYLGGVPATVHGDESEGGKWVLPKVPSASSSDSADQKEMIRPKSTCECTTLGRIAPIARSMKQSKCRVRCTIQRPRIIYFLTRLPTCAWKPLLIALTDLLDPHDMHDMKKIRFSFVRRVSKDLHVLQVTYSTIKQYTDQHKWRENR